MAARRPRAVIYLRQSTFREESISLDMQETACRDHATREGYQVVAVEADPGITGRTFDRPAVRRVMDLVATGGADVVLLWKWSRLSRSRKDWAVAADQIEQRGGRIESATEAIDTSTSTGRLARGVMVEFAAFESERIGDGWREAHARRIAHGRPANGKARFGYRYDRDAKLHVPDPVTGPILADSYRRYLAGESVYALVQWIRDTGATPAEGYGVQTGEWTHRTLRRVLDSGFGAGYIRAAGELLPGVHEPVITEAEWERYRERRSERRTRRRAERSEYLLSGLVHCACGARMQAGQHTTTGPRLRCKAAVEQGRHEGGYVQERFVVDAVRETITALAADVNARVDLKGPAPGGRDRLGELERDREKILGSLTRLAMQAAEGAISDEVHARAAGEYDRRLQQIQVEVKRHQSAVEDPVVPLAAVAGLVEDWDVMPVPALRAMLGELLESIVVTPGRERLIVVTPRVGEPRSFR